MNLAFAIIFLWAGAACLWLGSRNTGATTPWGAFSAVLSKVRDA